jgi:hypothetical protein
VLHRIFSSTRGQHPGAALALVGSKRAQHLTLKPTLRGLCITLQPTQRVLEPAVPREQGLVCSGEVVGRHVSAPAEDRLQALRSLELSAHSPHGRRLYVGEWLRGRGGHAAVSSAAAWRLTPSSLTSIAGVLIESHPRAR